jgi:hypothetical protein
VKVLVLEDGTIRIMGADGASVDAPLPAGVVAMPDIGNGPSIAHRQGSVFICGGHNQNVSVTPFGTVVKIGVEAPASAPTLTVGAGAISGEMIGYTSFVVKDGDGVVIAESNLSPASDVLTVTNGGVVWSGLPTTTYDRVTHVRLYRSVTGSIPQMVAEVVEGTTTYTEAVEAAALGVTAAVKIGADGSTQLDTNARGVVPFCRLVEGYHDMMFYSGDPEHPERIYFSLPDEPHAVDVSEDDERWLSTPDGSAVTGLKRWGDVLIVTCKRSIHAVQAYDNGDVQIVQLSNFYGCISPRSLATVGPNGDLFFASHEGLCRYNGHFDNVLDDTLRDYWRDSHKAAVGPYETGYGYEDRIEGCYIYSVYTTFTFKWVVHYKPLLEKGQAYVVFDRRARRDGAAAPMLDSSGFVNVYTGSCDGYVRKENVDSNSNDDSDTYAKAMTITSKHFFSGDQSGDQGHGQAYQTLDLFLKNESTAVSVSLYGGDDSAIDRTDPWTRTVPAGAVSTPRARVTRTSFHLPVTEVGGKGVALKLTASSPVGVRFRGFAIDATMGHQDRGTST